MLAWGDIGSNMLSTYAHLTVDDADRELMQFYGVVPVEESNRADNTLSPQQCKHCGMLNPHSNEFCGGCGTALSADVANTMSDLQHIIDKRSADFPTHRADSSAKSEYVTILTFPPIC